MEVRDGGKGGRVGKVKVEVWGEGGGEGSRR